MSRRTWVAAAAALALCPALALAQSAWRQQAVPWIQPPAFVAMQHQHWYGPRATDWQQAGAALSAALAQDCATGRDWSAARPAWRRSLQAWDALATVAVGPLVERRSARRVDFQPTRPDAIARALQNAEAGPLDAELLGSAARGLPALEWLLWSPQAPRPQAAACRYATTLATDLQDEAAALAEGFARRSADEPDEALVVEQMSEAVNQWLGGIDALRMQAIERPLHEARTRGLARPVLPRGLAGAAASDRAARWGALRALMAFDGRVAPPVGTALLPVETVLRGKGRNPLADRLRAQVAVVDRALRAAQGDAPAALSRLSEALSALRRLVESEAAPALDIRIGFSDADGD